MGDGVMETEAPRGSRVLRKRRRDTPERYDPPNYNRGGVVLLTVAQHVVR